MGNGLDENTMNNIKNMVDSGDLNGAISQISPEMIQNFSKMFGQVQNSSNANSNNNNNNNFNNNTNNSNANNSSGSNNGFDLSGIDMNSIMKLAGSMNNKNDPRSNLLASLKPYLRDSKKGKLDNYMNLLNMSKIADVLQNNPNLKNGQSSNNSTYQKNNPNLPNKENY